MMSSIQRSAPHRSQPCRSRSRGATTVEYAVLVGLVVAVAIGSWQFLGHRIRCALGFASAQISADGHQGVCPGGHPAAATAAGQPGGPIAAP